VAIKVLPAEVGADPDRLNHPNILTVFDVGAHVAAGKTAVGAAAPAIPYVVVELPLAEERHHTLLESAAPSARHHPSQEDPLARRRLGRARDRARVGPSAVKRSDGRPQVTVKSP